MSTKCPVDSPLWQRVGHAHRMEPDRQPREILYGELREGVRREGRPLLRYKDVIKRDLRSAQIDTSAWEDIAKDRESWRQSVKAGVSKAEANARVQATCKRVARKERAASARGPITHICATCRKDCHTGIGLHSHTRSCPNPQPIASSRRGCHYYYVFYKLQFAVDRGHTNPTEFPCAFNDKGNYKLKPMKFQDMNIAKHDVAKPTTFPKLSFVGFKRVYI